MINDIKSNQSCSVLYTTEQSTNNANAQPKTIADDGVTVTQQLKGLLSILNQEAVPEDNSKVMAAKEMIQSRQYTVDMNALSEKLMESGLVMMHE